MICDADTFFRFYRYCEAIGCTLKLATKPSPYYHSHLLKQIKELSDRLMSSGQRDAAGSSWMGRVQRPRLDNLLSTIEGSLTKFVAGEEAEGDKHAKTHSDVAGGTNTSASAARIGPFSHYSSITPGSTSSGVISRAQSHNDLPSIAPSPPPSTSYFPALAASQPARRHSHQRSVSMGYAPYGADPYGSGSHFAPPPPPEDATPGWGTADQGTSEDPTTTTGGGGWWAAATGGDTTPYAATNATISRAPSFTPLSASFAEDASGFISPMGPISPAITPQPSQSNFRASMNAPPTVQEEDDDDLGLGNSTRSRPGENGDSPRASGEMRREEGTKEAAKPPSGKQQGFFFFPFQASILIFSSLRWAEPLMRASLYW
jgi:hypothetical protein